MANLYRTLITVEVLHDRPLGDMELADVAHEIVEGDFSGKVTFGDPEKVSRERMAELLTAQGSDPAFLLGDEEEETNGQEI